MFNRNLSAIAHNRLNLTTAEVVAAMEAEINRTTATNLAVGVSKVNADTYVIFESVFEGVVLVVTPEGITKATIDTVEAFTF